jgi:hypothetical protein
LLLLPHPAQLVLPKIWLMMLLIWKSSQKLKKTSQMYRRLRWSAYSLRRAHDAQAEPELLIASAAWLMCTIGTSSFVFICCVRWPPTENVHYLIYSFEYNLSGTGIQRTPENRRNLWKRFAENELSCLLAT